MGTNWDRQDSSLKKGSELGVVEGKKLVAWCGRRGNEET